MPSWWRYNGRCVGRVFHFLYHYCGFDVAEHARLGKTENGRTEIIYHGKLIATFNWSEKVFEKDVPEFDFIDNETYCNNQVLKRDEAILDATFDIPCQTEKVSDRVMKALQGNLYYCAKNYAAVLNTDNPEFLLGEASFNSSKQDCLFFKSGNFVAYAKMHHRKVHDDEICEWLRLTKYA